MIRSPQYEDAYPELYEDPVGPSEDESEDDWESWEEEDTEDLPVPLDDDGEDYPREAP